MTEDCGEMLAMKDERIHALELYVAELEEELREREEELARNGNVVSYP